MSERGILLALQRLHDDPGFADMVQRDPQNTLGIYDLDETECQTLINAVQSGDNATLQQMASNVGVDWGSTHIRGAGALDENDVSIESGSGGGIRGPNSLTGDGYEGVSPGSSVQG
jgi:hypothetical protein